MFSQPYIQYPVRAGAYVRSCLLPCIISSHPVLEEQDECVVDFVWPWLASSDK